MAQEVLFRISSRVSELDRTRDPLSWAFGIATFEILTQRKRRVRRRETLVGDTMPDSPASAPSAEDNAIQTEVHAALADALGQLSPEDVEHLGLLESARVAPTTPAMRKRRQRALERLRTIWRNIYGQS